jgi:hypothetical protein
VTDIDCHRSNGLCERFHRCDGRKRTNGEYECEVSHLILHFVPAKAGRTRGSQMSSKGFFAQAQPVPRLIWPQTSKPSFVEQALQVPLADSNLWTLKAPEGGRPPPHGSLSSLGAIPI